MKDELRLLARLAGFHPEEVWLEQLSPQLEAMLLRVESLKELDLVGAEPAFIEPAREEP